MEYTLGTIRRDVLVDMLDDEEFDPEIVNRAINRAQREIFNQFELSFMEKIYAGDVSEGTTMIKYPADLAQVQNHVVTDPEGSERSIESSYIPFREFTSMFPDPSSNAPGELSYWTSYGGSIIFSQPLSKDYKLTLYYTKKPTPLLVDSDIPEVPEEFGELLALGAYIRIAKRNEDTDLANIAIQDYAGMLNKLVDRYGYRKTGPIKMKTRYVGRR